MRISRRAKYSDAQDHVTRTADQLLRGRPESSSKTSGMAMPRIPRDPGSLAGHNLVAYDATLRGVEESACVYRILHGG